MAMPGIIITRIFCMAFETHMKPNGKVLVIRETQSQFLKHPRRAPAVSMYMVHAVAIAEVVKQSANSNTAFIQGWYRRMKSDVLFLCLLSQQIGLPGMIGQTTRIAMMVMALGGEKSSVSHVRNDLLHILAPCRTKRTDYAFLYCHRLIIEFSI